MKTSILATCPHCGASQRADFYGGINTSENPELKTRVKDGSLFIWECGQCGSRNLLTGQTIYHDPETRLMIWLLPDGLLPEESFLALERSLERAAETLEGYVFRRVMDAGSLIEKVNIFDCGLEDTVMEMCKYVTGMEMAEKLEDAPEGDVQLRFFRMEGPDNELVFSYPGKDGMKAVSVGFNVYEDCAGILRRNPSIKPSGGFPVVDKNWIARFFR